MSSTVFNPLKAYCAEWRKIYPDYRRHLDFYNPKTCSNSPCKKAAPNRCSACQKVAYCSPECQKSHWKTIHKTQCCPFKIVRNPDQPDLGRFVVATRDIAPGEVIMEEPPITAGNQFFFHNDMTNF